MSVVDLSSRITQDWDKYNGYLKSSDSLIYIDGDILLKNVGPASVNITVGNRWYDYSKNKYFTIPSNGIKLKSKDNITIEISQTIGLPYNIFGAIFGTGKNIFKGGFISTGKINPGYKGKLKIGYYNGSMGDVTFKPGDLLACCTFFEMETSTDSPLEFYISEPEPEVEIRNIYSKIKHWIHDNWYSVLSSILAIIAIVVAILK